jgi:hypothetical protein
MIGIFASAILEFEPAEDLLASQVADNLFRTTTVSQPQERIAATAVWPSLLSRGSTALDTPPESTGPGCKGVG